MSAFPSVADTEVLMYLDFSPHMQLIMGLSWLQKCLFSSLHSLSFILPAIHFNRLKNCKLWYNHNHRRQNIRTNRTTFRFTSSVSLIPSVSGNSWELFCIPVMTPFPLRIISGATKQVDFSYCSLPWKISKILSFFIFYHWIILHCMDLSLFIHLPILVFLDTFSMWTL